MSKIEKRRVSDHLDDLYNERGERFGSISRHHAGRPFIVIKSVTLDIVGARALADILMSEVVSSVTPKQS